MPTSKVHCPQCGGALEPDEGQAFLTCPFCASAVYLDRSRVVFHWSLRPTLDEASARGALRRWMAGNQTVKDLDVKSALHAVDFSYFPLWSLQVDGHDRLEPAAATSVTELRHLRLPAGDLIPYTAELDSLSTTPTVPLEAMLSWRQGGAAAPGKIGSISLVHVPLYTFRYEFGDQSYLALVEGVSGRVFANLYPAKAEAPYRMVALMVLVVFVGLATLPILGALIDPQQGAWIGGLACVGLGALAAPFLFAGAVWVASRV